MINKLNIDETYWARRPKAPTENSIVILDNINNIQTQTLFKIEKENIQIALFTIRSQIIY